MPPSDIFDPQPSDETPIACDLSVLDDPEEHDRHSNALLDDREEMRQVEGGYALRCPGTMDYAERILDFSSASTSAARF